MIYEIYHFFIFSFYQSKTRTEISETHMVSRQNFHLNDFIHSPNYSDESRPHTQTKSIEEEYIEK